jgi:hypothetical protein
MKVLVTLTTTGTNENQFLSIFLLFAEIKIESKMRSTLKNEKHNITKTLNSIFSEIKSTRMISKIVLINNINFQ